MSRSISTLEEVVAVAESFIGKIFRLVAMIGLVVFVASFVGALAQRKYGLAVSFGFLSLAAFWVATKRHRIRAITPSNAGPLQTLAEQARQLAEAETNPRTKRELIVQADRLSRDTKVDRKDEHSTMNEADVVRYRNGGAI